MRTIGSQIRETLKESGYKLLEKKGKKAILEQDGKKNFGLKTTIIQGM